MKMIYHLYNTYAKLLKTLNVMFELLNVGRPKNRINKTIKVYLRKR
jgi:hypothetical protein